VSAEAVELSIQSKQQNVEDAVVRIYGQKRENWQNNSKYKYFTPF
jgi:hypothetical protein